jgi:hypothetical protein
MTALIQSKLRFGLPVCCTVSVRTVPKSSLIVALPLGATPLLEAANGFQRGENDSWLHLSWSKLAGGYT